MSSSFDVEQLSAELRAPIGLRTASLGRDALDSLGQLVEGKAVVLTDATPKLRGNAELLGEVERRLPGDATRVVLEGRHGRVHADEETLDAAAREAGAAGASCLVSVGSGTLADIGKAVSVKLGGMRHVVVQTATSVNGFADDQSVLLIKGVKRTTHTRWPDALVADADVLVGAPAALNLAGVGDLLAMFTAPADWRLAHLLGMADAYSAPAVALARRHGPRVLDLAPRLAQGDAEASTEIARVLTLSGISMGVSGTTAPASGMEHTVSHLVEMAMNRRGQESAYHGAQVGVSTVVAATLWARVRKKLEAGRLPVRFPEEGEMEERVRDAFAALDPSGEMGEECWNGYLKKLRRWSARRAQIDAADWPAIAGQVSSLLGDPRELAGALARAGAPTRFAELDPPVPPDLARWALANCHLMRDRFTVADLAFLAGGWEAADVDAALDEAARAGGGL